MISSDLHQPTLARRQTALGVVVVGVLALFQAAPAFAEYGGGQETSSLRSPLIPGALWTDPNQAPMEGTAPPVGSGMSPPPVTPGHQGGPLPPPSDVSLPPMGPMDKSAINGMVAPYLQPPPSTPGADPGSLPGTGGLTPPVAQVDINPGGGISGQAPIYRWGGQTTRDLGSRKTNGSQTTDFGQDIDNLPSVQSRGIQRSVTQDGPRQATFPGQFGSTSNRQASLPGAATTQDLHGNRQLFKGPYSRSTMTIAPY